jgi:hypothetical protein
VVTLRSSLVVYLKMSFGIRKGGGCVLSHTTHPDVFAPDPSGLWWCPLRSLRLPWRGFHNAAFGLQVCRDLVPWVWRVTGYSQTIWIRLFPSSGKRWGNPRTPYEMLLLITWLRTQPSSRQPRLGASNTRLLHERFGPSGTRMINTTSNIMSQVLRTHGKVPLTTTT